MKNGKLLKNSQGKPFFCDHCPCGSPFDPCCDAGSMSATATATFTMDGVTFTGIPLAFFTAGLNRGYSATYLCLTDSNVEFLIGAACNTIGDLTTWFLVARIRTIAPSPSPVFMEWATNYVAAGATVSASCSPFHFHAEAYNSGSIAGVGNVACGITAGALGTVLLVVDVVTP